MIKSMTGFGNSQADIAGVGKVSIEIRSVNHRFLDIVCHLPDGFSYLEERIKKEIARKIKRGRVTCLFNILSKPTEKLLINRELVREYYLALNKLKKELRLEDPVKLETLINLPGTIKLQDSKEMKNSAWPKLRLLMSSALLNLVKTREKEGQALYVDLKQRNAELKNALEIVKVRFGRVIKERLCQIATPEEKASFLKSSDISEEITRMRFHLSNFQKKLSQTEAVGKELDFIAQELSREANTMGAKSIDAIIASNVVGMKSQIEKMREQLQNVE